MTIERLEELNGIKEQMADLKEYIDTLSGIDYDSFELNGRYKRDASADFIFSFNNMEKHALNPLSDFHSLVCDGLEDVIISFLKEKLAKLEKEFEEA